ncbi:MAG: acetylglutamate kinase [Eggerthellaceae bacterium]|nr:acetylglutamate kinase [Eggerthellaceae bacterium]
MVGNFSNSERIEVLRQALPYIKKYNGKVVVVKYGGNAMIDENLKQEVMADIVLLWLIGVKVVVVHGGGPEISDAMQRQGIQPKWVDGLRYTDEETMDIVKRVLAGKVNKGLVNMVQMHGGKAMGIAGMDGHLISAEQKDPSLGLVGEITGVNVEPLTVLLEHGYIPIVSSLGCDDAGNVYNINSDTAAAYIAGALKAERLVLLTDVNGLRRDVNDPDSLIPEISVEMAREMVDNGGVSGGMKPKLACCIKAIEEGTGNVIMLDGRVNHAVLMELLTDEGAGTLVRGRARQKLVGLNA